MKPYREAMEFFVKYLEKVMGEIKDSEVEALIEEIKNARRIFVVGAGRSGLVGRAFAMRLMHLGIVCYVVGETVTPSIKEGDLLLAISGSGSTQMVVHAATAAKLARAKAASITSNRHSNLGNLSDVVVVVKGRSKEKSDDFIARQLSGEHEPLAPMGTLFELCAMVFFDSVISEIASQEKKGDKEFRYMHSNIE